MIDGAGSQTAVRGSSSTALEFCAETDSPLEEDGFELPVPRKVDDAFETAVFASGHLPFHRPTYSRGSNPLSSARFDIDFT